MYNSSDEFIDSIFLSYEKILTRLKLLDIKTKMGQEITHHDLRQAVNIMEKKHPNCRWKSVRLKSKRHFVLYEGFLWLVFVYFQTEKSIIDADIYFFENRILEYEKKLEIEHKTIFQNNIPVDNLDLFFDRKKDTIRKAINKMDKINSNFKYAENGNEIISKEGIEWLCRNCFKKKYLELLEDYKMDLTEKYIEAGYLYDYFFGLN